METVLLEHNKAWLLDTRRRLIPTVESIEDSIVEDVRSAGGLSNAPTHLAGENDEGVDRDVELAQNEEGLLEEVESALGRIEQGTYGRCEGCGREISAERLAALPYAPLCIRCGAA